MNIEFSFEKRKESGPEYLSVAEGEKSVAALGCSILSGFLFQMFRLKHRKAELKRPSFHRSRKQALSPSARGIRSRENRPDKIVRGKICQHRYRYFITSGKEYLHLFFLFFWSFFCFFCQRAVIFSFSLSSSLSMKSFPSR